MQDNYRQIHGRRWYREGSFWENKRLRVFQGKNWDEISGFRAANSIAGIMGRSKRERKGALSQNSGILRSKRSNLSNAFSKEDKS